MALLSFSKMANQIDIIKSDYLTIENITAKLRADGLGEYLEFKSNGEYEFLECENCNGPMLGHQVTKCRHTEGYEENTIARFKKWLKRIPELRKLIDERAVNEADRAIGAQGEIMGRVLRDTTEARSTTQLVKARQPPGWTGQ